MNALPIRSCRFQPLSLIHIFHVLGGGVGDDIRPPFNGTAVHRRGECVVHDEGDAVSVGCLGEFFNVQDGQGRVGDGLAEDRLGVGTAGRCV